MKNALIAILAITLALLAGTSNAATSANPPKPATVLAALKSEGLPVGTYRVYTESTDGNKLLGRPGQYVGKANFHDKRLEKSATYDTSSGGAVEVFASRAAALNRFKYLKAITQSMPLLVEYDYLEGLVLLRVAGDLTPTQARKYEAALRKRF